MTEIKRASHLKGSDTEGRAITHSGQAYFAGSGPRGKVCRECNHFNWAGYRQTDKLPKNASCRKGNGKAFPASALACKYFDLNRNAPTPMAPVNP